MTQIFPAFSFTFVLFFSFAFRCFVFSFAFRLCSFVFLCVCSSLCFSFRPDSLTGHRYGVQRLFQILDDIFDGFGSHG